MRGIVLFFAGVAAGWACSTLVGCPNQETPRSREAVPEHERATERDGPQLDGRPEGPLPTAATQSRATPQVDADALRRDAVWVYASRHEAAHFTPTHVEALAHHLRVARQSRDPVLFRAALEALRHSPLVESRELLLGVAEDLDLELPSRSVGFIIEGLRHAPAERTRRAARARLEQALPHAQSEPGAAAGWAMLLGAHADAGDVEYLGELATSRSLQPLGWAGLAFSPREDARNRVLAGLSTWAPGITLDTVRALAATHPRAVLAWMDKRLSEPVSPSSEGRVPAHYLTPAVSYRVPDPHVPAWLSMLRRHASGAQADAALSGVQELVLLKRVSRAEVASIVDAPLRKTRDAVAAWRTGSLDSEALQRRLRGLLTKLDASALYERAEDAQTLEEIASELRDHPFADRVRKRADAIRKRLARPWRGE